MIESDLSFSHQTANVLMKIAKHPSITDSGSSRNLPSSWRVLQPLTRLSEHDFKDAQARGLITKDTSIRAADAIAVTT